ncbi:MAG: hypothetical protein IPJ98_21170 [Bryobacterales bacterium]|nr:hypothetical protein [Bryobacterales bacterium]
MGADPGDQPRGLINAFSTASPVRSHPGGLLWVNGINLGPVDGFTAPPGDWPTTIGDPALQVMVNGRPAAIGSANPSRLVIQIPWEIAAGAGAGNIVQVVVVKGEVRSRPAFVRVLAANPALRVKGDTGIGEAFTTGARPALKLSATGLGNLPADQRPENGKAVATEWPGAVRAYVDGLPAKVKASLPANASANSTSRLRFPKAPPKAASSPCLPPTRKPPTAPLSASPHSKPVTSPCLTPPSAVRQVRTASCNRASCWLTRPAAKTAAIPPGCLTTPP